VTRLRIHHSTTYSYRKPVAFLPHRLMLRPRESRDLKLLENEVLASPQTKLVWAQDVFGNTVATASFDTSADALTITSCSEVELLAHTWPVFDIAASAQSFPFLYARDEWTDLGGLMLQQYLDVGGRLSNWARSFVLGPETGTLALLKDLSVGVSAAIAYESREVEGTQTPTETLDRGAGSCRDIATLFIEAARSLGFGARIVSGYLYTAEQSPVGAADSGSTTHAWAEVYLPGAGWITFDPTNRSLGGANLIPVAVGRDIRQVTPVSGGYVGNVDAFMDMVVEVRVEAMQT
jgi:transglutaminase-like putative cysteine protease